MGAFANVAVDWLGWGQTWEPFTAPGAYLVRNTFTAVTDVNYYRQIGWQSVNSRGFGFNDLVNHCSAPVQHQMPMQPRRISLASSW